METILVLIAGALAGMALLVALRGSTRWSRVAWLSVPVFVGVGVAGWLNASSHRAKPQAELANDLPRPTAESNYVSSAQCRDCHPQEYASWHASFHRRMTQPATPEAVQASFGGVQFKFGGSTFRLTQRGDEFWIEKHTPIQDATDGRPAKDDRRVVMTTGSHHMQGFWVARGVGNLLDQLPLMWLVKNDEEPGRWIPIADSFLGPPGHEVNTPWNTNCIFCHSVHGVPGIDRQMKMVDTKVAELGIACEACHGPGKTHVAAHHGHEQRNPASATRMPDETIVHPKRLTAERSAQVCGQCHSVAKFANEKVGADWLSSGSSYRPGDDLDQTRLTLSVAALSGESDEAMRGGNFWPDGMVRVAGREYNGLLDSACYQRGGMTCLSCHSMHDSRPDDQLASGMQGNQACSQCHRELGEKLAEHTHHAATSSGSLCYNCHMPHTTYGLFKAIRSHQISSPNVATTIETGRPNACNLCHLDQTLAWTGEMLSNWYGQEPVALDDDQRNVAAGILWLLRGDAVQRALLAWACGWPTAREASGDDWQAPLLAPLLEDPYSAVRLIAARSLRRLGYDFDYDFVGSSEARRSARQRILQRWRSLPLASRGRPEQSLLRDGTGALDEESVGRLLRERDDRPVRIQE